MKKIIIFGVLAIVILLGVKLLPYYGDNMLTLNGVVDELDRESKVYNRSEEEVKDWFLSRLDENKLDYIDADSIEITLDPENKTVLVDFDYVVTASIIGGLTIDLPFSGPERLLQE